MIVQQSGAVTTIVCDDVSAGWEKSILVQSDIHHDSIYCNRELERRHLNAALQQNAIIIIGGDLFDAMQGRFDPRRNLDELRPEYRRSDYYDYVVQDVAEFLSPYAQQIVMISDGNHELSVLKNANTNLTDRLVYALRSQYQSPAVHGGYGGWIRILLKRPDGKSYSRDAVKIKFFHGAGGDAPVTRGVIQTNRQAVYLPDADIVINGHNHHTYYVPIQRERLGSHGQLYSDIQHHIRIPGYKAEYADGQHGWMVERGGVPKPLGAFWIRLTAFDHEVKINIIPDIHPG